MSLTYIMYTLFYTHIEFASGRYTCSACVNIYVRAYCIRNIFALQKLTYHNNKCKLCNTLQLNGISSVIFHAKWRRQNGQLNIGPFGGLRTHTHTPLQKRHRTAHSNNVKIQLIENWSFGQKKSNKINWNAH